MNRSRIIIASAAMAIVIIGIVIWIGVSSDSIHDLPEIVDSGRLTVVTEGGSMGFALAKDSIFGFQYEIIKAFADSLGVELQISEQNDTKKAIEGLKTGEYDIVANVVPVTTEYTEGVVFTKTLISTRQILVQRIPTDSLQKNIISKQYELANDTVFVPYNSAYKMRIKNLSDEIAETIHIIEVKDVSAETMVRLVSEGKIKNTICSEQLSYKLKRQYPNIDISLPIGFTQDHSWVVNAESKKLIEKLNDFLSDFIGSTAYWELYRKYY